MILSILFVWRRSDLFNVSLITGYVSLHNQTTPYITLSNLVFTSHCICFDYITIWPVSSAYTIGVTSFAWLQYIGCWLWTGHYLGYLFPDYLFPAFFVYLILICFMPAAQVSPVLSPLHLRCIDWLWTGHCSVFIVSGAVC